MPFMKGREPLRRTLEYLKSDRFVINDRVRIFSVNYNTYGKHHGGARDFVFFSLPQIQLKNPKVQIITLKNKTPSPFVRCYFDNGRDILIDIDNQNRDDIIKHLVKVIGKTRDQLNAEARLAESKDNPANFGYCSERHCICEIPNQASCSGIVPLPKDIFKLPSKQEC